MEKSCDREKYCREEKSGMLELLKLETEEFDKFLKNEKIDSWLELNNILEDRLYEVIKLFEIYLLASENHSRGVRLIRKMIEEAIKDKSMKYCKVTDISDNR